MVCSEKVLGYLQSKIQTIQKGPVKIIFECCTGFLESSDTFINLMEILTLNSTIKISLDGIKQKNDEGKVSMN